MLYTISYIEEMHPGWRKFDTAVWENLQRTFAVDKHYFIGDGHVKMLRDVIDHIEEHENRLIRFVNVQPLRFWQSIDEGFRYIEDFLHPMDACYIFGSNQQKVETTLGRNVAIRLEDSTLFSFCAASIVLSHRLNQFTAG